jgi:hypothetical protein
MPNLAWIYRCGGLQSPMLLPLSIIIRGASPATVEQLLDGVNDGSKKISIMQNILAKFDEIGKITIWVRWVHLLLICDI